MRVMILVALALPLSVSSQTVHQAPWMTGERLLALVAFPQPVSKSKLDIFLDEQRAKLYIHGVHDATEGKGWCFGITRHPKPDLLEQEAIDGIKGLAPEQLKRNAADLLVDIWRVKNPCAVEVRP